MNDDDSIRDTITPKSDQLNADDLIAGSITVTITGWKRGGTAEQPVSLDITGGHKPYIPCKSMRRVLIAEWGDKPRDWVGRSITLYCDPAVMFGGVRVGGIRISHMSHMENPRREHMLTTTRSKRAPFVVQRITEKQPSQPAVSSSGVTDQQVTELRSRLARHIPNDDERKTYVVTTLGVKGKPTLGSSWTREQYATATIFCDEQEGPV